MEIRWLLIWTIHLNHQQGNKPECGKCYIELLFDKASIWYRRQDTGQTTLCVTFTCQHIYTACCLEQILCAVEKKFSQLLVVLSEHQEKGKALDFFCPSKLWLGRSKNTLWTWAEQSQDGLPSTKSQAGRVWLWGSLWLVCSELLLWQEWWCGFWPLQSAAGSP